MKLKNLTRLLLVVLMASLVSIDPMIFGNTNMSAAQTISCPPSNCNPSCGTTPTPCPGCETVTPCNMHDKGWDLHVGTDTPGGTPMGGFAFKTGPACPPASLGSAEFTVGPDGNSFFRLRNRNFNGTLLSDLAALSYCTYVQFRQPGTCVAPYIGLTIDLNGDGQFDDVLFFEPCYQSGLFWTFDSSKNIQVPSFAGEFYPVQNGGTVAECSWQCWDAKIGAWWSAADLVNGNIPAFTTLANYFGRNGNANAKILNPDNCKGGVRIEGGEGAGPWDCFIGNADKFTIAVGANSVTYDFEAANCEIPQCGTSPATAITACKFYDFNANGTLDAGDSPLSNWPITISPLGAAVPNQATQSTGANGCVSWGNLDTLLNPYTVTEGTPNQSNWVHSTPGSVSVNVVFGESSAVNFGNYCRVPSGGLTLGFWSNKNGQAILKANDPAWRTLLNGCCLRNADGSLFTIPGGSFATAYAAFRTWLLGATATNMAYMLSAQLAAMKLNIAFGSVNPGAFAVCSGMTISQLVAKAAGDPVAGLCADGNTPSGDPHRAIQEAWKNCLDALNNGGLVVPPVPCPYTFPPASTQTVALQSSSMMGLSIRALFP